MIVPANGALTATSICGNNEHALASRVALLAKLRNAPGGPTLSVSIVATSSSAVT